jgi:RND family efflux transporter MFP subunit
MMLRSRQRRLGSSGFALACAALASSVALVGCGGAPAASSLPVPKVTVAEVVSTETTDADEYIGRTEASEIVEVRARVFGYLKSVDFKDGDYVKKGDKLFTIEADEYEAIHNVSVARIAVAKTQFNLAKTTAARNEPLVKTGSVTKQEYDENLAQIEEANAAIKAAEADAARTAVDLKHTELFSPIDGRVDRALLTPGNLLTGGASSGTLLTKIVNEKPMYVYFDVDERSLLRYMRMRGETEISKPGNLSSANWPCYLQLADEKEFPHEGKLDFASAEVTTSTGTARIRAVFDNDDGVLASGLFVRLKIPLSRKPYAALMIPERSLATDLSVKYVYVVGGDGKAERRNVELGGQVGDLRIIKSGLKAGEQVIVKGVQRVKPGQQVEVERAVAKHGPATESVTSQER